MHKSTKYYRICKEKEEYDLFLNKDEATENIRNCLHYRENEKHLWHIKEYNQDVRIVEGNLDNWGTKENPLLHVTWSCPACNKTHSTDINPSKKSPGLWFCEYLDEIFWVTWKST